MYKIVDTFNGWSSRTYQKRADAESQLTEDLKAFYAHPGHHNTQFCKVVMHSKVTWGWNEKRNQFCWE